MSMAPAVVGAALTNGVPGIVGVFGMAPAGAGMHFRPMASTARMMAATATRIRLVLLIAHPTGSWGISSLTQVN